jgi:hypothetical protein
MASTRRSHGPWTDTPVTDRLLPPATTGAHHACRLATPIPTRLEGTCVPQHPAVTAANSEYSEGKLILAMLALLTVDAFVERADLLHSVSKRIDAIYARVGASNREGIAFVRRIEQAKMAELVRTSKRSVWIAGPSLDSAVQCQDALQEQLEAGRDVRLLMIEPSTELVAWYGKHVVGATYSFNTAAEHARAKQRVEENIDRLTLLKQVRGGRFELKTLERMMWFGFLIIDAETTDVRMDVQIYLYKTSVERAPILSFSRSSDRAWFSTFYDQYKMLWQEAQTR